jgi:glycosyltransferase involved in cell wall biosynthesis
MKITFVLTRPGLDGGTRVIAAHAERLRRRGHEVVAVSTPRRPGTVLDYVRAIVRGKSFPRRSTRRMPSHIDNTGVAHRTLDRFRPVTDADVPDADVVVATWWETAEWVATLGPSKGAKAHFIQGYETWGGPPDQVMAVWRLPLHKIVISRWLLDLAAEEFGDHDVSLVPNSVDLDRFHSPPRRRQSWPTIGFVYSALPIKGLDVAFDAIERARASFPTLRIIAFGSRGPVSELPLPPGTEYHRSPPQEELPRLYASCDAWLFSSRREGFGLPLLEAMACRTPVVATPAGAAPELLAEGGGLLVRPEDATDMARGICHLLALSQEQWRTMSDAAFVTATRYTWDNAADQMEAALQRAVEKATAAVEGAS